MQKQKIVRKLLIHTISLFVGVCVTYVILAPARVEGGSDGHFQSRFREPELPKLATLPTLLSDASNMGPNGV